jgi:LuxR family maltose regulon positive regulatory protein
LDAADNDATRFWSYVITALASIYPGVGSTPLALLQSPQPPPGETLLTMLLNEISAESAGAPISKGVLVLDDYHAIDAPAIHQSLAALVDYLPPHLHLVITTRVDPPLHLARWRARGLLVELRAADLRFTPEEAATFLTQVMGLPLSADDVAALEARTEGWIAGLQLAALAMRGRTDLAGFIAAFTGSNHFVMDYLVQEVLEQLPAHLRTFILQTSILGRLCGSLCDAVLSLTTDHRPPTTDQADADSMFVVRRSPALSPSLRSRVNSAEGSFVDSYSQRMLEELDRRHLFVVALDDVRGWYRYHHLFADLAQAELRRSAPQAQVAALHRRASLWFHEHTLPDEAIQHGLHASDMALTAMLVEHYAQSSLDNASLRVQGWLAQLPAEVVQAHPRLAIYLVRSLTHVGRYEEAIRLLDTAPALNAPDLPPDVVAYSALMRARYDRLFGDSTHFPALLQEAHAKAPPDDVRLQAAIALEECLIAVYTDDVLQAQTRVAEAIRRCNAAELHAPRLLAQFLGLLLLTHCGQLNRALREGMTAVRHAAPQTIREAVLQVMLALILVEQDRLAEAETWLDKAMGLMEHATETLMTARGYWAQARIARAQGDTAKALAILDRGVATFVQNGTAATLVRRRMAAFQAQAYLWRGALDAAVTCAREIEPAAGSALDLRTFEEDLALVRVRIAQGGQASGGPYLDDAQMLLDRWLPYAEATGRTHIVIQVCVLRALLYKVRGAQDAALEDLERALALAEPEGYIHLFVDEGPAMAELLRQIAERRLHSAPHIERPSSAGYVKRLLAAIGQAPEIGKQEPAAMPPASAPPSDSILMEPLSARELEVLGLVAAGLSNQAIAQKLVVALSTVKKHIANSYAKLDVQSRTQAIARARELNLIS